MIRGFKDEGIVLARRNYSEADRILVLYTKNCGKLSMIAKGVRKPSSRKRASIEMFSKINFQAATGRGLDILTETEILDSFDEIRSNLPKVSVAYFFCEVVGKITRDDERNASLYSLLIDYLGKLKTSLNLRTLRAEFTKDALVLSGFWPEGKPLDDPDQALESVTEKKINSIRVGKKLTS
ncbi:DNA repair protein RecO [Candidatus Woesebacteria bacterium RIFCSPHIGHO2_01_FULL_44_10]|uniref:DNA repair protein RecO n=1 Tax=Candidatus Woesebacteria bacterium RIFCSPLOWO2_01_FULL_44_14 TaxID=1802525 RepID=A0A1F8C362_9BACT|nr:MAG: DNA repair protein RecO [Candidatus Woesebacteria bacterium RIFCSPHIGHO2_01_FULL_44_10]OGM56025.1 MAG: DNA repair protein RecO [Candidatus Woesebacteria bacterium RIFCSPHIGHO2_12_FULL_44_11]OGM70747.1 MAG: DNA repair protein RecO [Candidatus Woesebacteria bacterium RIFCSPLOWO2_01_FULL_44_14]